MRRFLVVVFPLLHLACLSGTQATVDSGAATGDGGSHLLPDTSVTTDAPTANAPDSGVAFDASVPHFDAVADGTLPSLDAGLPEGGSFGDGSTASRCTMSATAITCTSSTYTITTAAGSGAGGAFPSYARVVHYQVPLGTPPSAGWPAVFMYQGSFLSAAYTFAATSDEAYGMYYQTELVKNLLDAGYAVLAPEALDSGDSYWETNIAPYATSWDGCPDDLLVKAMLSDVSAGTFGPLDGTKLYATGISSGGYMTSRMAVSYAGKFHSLAIESGSYATCLSSECIIPTLPASHPPTLLLHGDLDTVIVPEATVTDYVTALKAAGVPEDEIDDADSGHQWIPEAPAQVLAWFQKYP